MGARRYLTAAVAIGAVATTTGCLGGTDNGSGSGDGATTATTTRSRVISWKMRRTKAGSTATAIL